MSKIVNIYLTSKLLDFIISEIFEAGRSMYRPCLSWNTSWNLWPTWCTKAGEGSVGREKMHETSSIWSMDCVKLGHLQITSSKVLSVLLFLIISKLDYARLCWFIVDVHFGIWTIVFFGYFLNAYPLKLLKYDWEPDLIKQDFLVCAEILTQSILSSSLLLIKENNSHPGGLQI